ncbi:MAG TPA: hypothetical protein VHR16_08930 [Candidatus Limnocylindrales bacterium]|jgi:hypothetical protein|nr:hypothetical protein [Candidatus Limnocylindrales bacterium]
MIVVGLLAESSSAAEIARRAAAAGAKVELVGLVPGDADWDERLFELAAAGVGHATVVRSARTSMEAADLDLALRYLPDIRCVVLAAPPTSLLNAAMSGADFAGASLVLVGPLDAEALAAISSAPIVLDPPPNDADGTFAGFVAALAVRLDRGEPPESAFRATVSALAADPA